MANRHKSFARGGGAKQPLPEHQREIEKEAGLKRGGKATHKVPGRASGGRLDKRARGGGVGSDCCRVVRFAGRVSVGYEDAGGAGLAEFFLDRCWRRTAVVVCGAQRGVGIFVVWDRWSAGGPTSIARGS